MSDVRKKEKLDICHLSSDICSLRLRADFLAVAKTGRKWITPGFVLQLGPSPDNALRYGLTATLKSLGNAVRRNKARRRLRSLVREVLASHASPGHDYVLVARAEALTRDYAEMKKDLLWALKKTGACRAE
jgi:ribonuclease P protein component